MGPIGKQTLIAKCPACQASTKVNVYPGKLSIKCPRCQASVPLAFARKYSKDQQAETHNPPVQPSVDSSAYASEVPIDSGTGDARSSRRKRSQRSSSGQASEFSYPDHAKGFVQYSFLIAIVLGLGSILLAGYLYWGTLANARNQEYVNNVKDSLDQHAQATQQIRKVLDPLESAEAQKSYREAKGKIEFLAAQRRKMASIDPTKIEELKDLQEKLNKAEKELALAEEDVKRLTSQISVQPLKQEPDSVALRLGSSMTSGPPKTTSETTSPTTTAPKVVDDKTVVISIPGITKTQWSDEFVKRFSLIADNGEGQVKANWSGDLLTLEVRPVVDPARYATKINFARLLYYSRNDRAITIEFKPERVNNYTAQGDIVTPILIDLKQRDKLNKLLPALGQLSNQKVDPSRQAEVAAVLEILAGDLKLDAIVRDSAIKLLPNWSGRESADLLIRLLDDKDGVVRLSAIEALVACHSPKAAEELAKRWEKLDPERVTRGLIAIGSEAEATVLPYLVNTTSLSVRTEACRVLKEIGTSIALKPLLDLMNMKEQSPVLANVAKEAMKGILDRQSK